MKYFLVNKCKSFYLNLFSFEEGTRPCPECPVYPVTLLENPTLLAGKPLVCTVR